MCSLRLVPNHGIEAMRDAEAVLLVEAMSTGVAFGDREREALDAGGLKAENAMTKQGWAEAEAAQRRADA